MSGEQTINRKYEHIEIVLRENVVYPGRCRDTYRDIKLIHMALPMIDYNDVDTSIEFLGRDLSAPLMITGMTGGHRETTEINRVLARVAEKTGIAIGVGSQRAMLEKNTPEIVYSYRVVREEAPSVPVIGNIGANTLNDIGWRDVQGLVDAIEADAIAVHLNPGQELIQPEGDTRFSSRLIDKISELVDNLSVPVIVKEVGTGLSMETVKALSDAGVEIFDVSGACGTNWMIVERYRRRDNARIFTAMGEWGIPTPIAVVEARWASPSSHIIASGGVWSGYEAALNIALGANMAGFALPILRAVVEGGVEAGIRFVENYISDLRATMFLAGASDIEELRRIRNMVIAGATREYLGARGIDIDIYMSIKGWRR